MSTCLVGSLEQMVARDYAVLCKTTQALSRNALGDRRVAETKTTASLLHADVGKLSELQEEPRFQRKILPVFRF